MPLINKANVVSQLNTVLSGLTVATEDTTRLLVLLKTAKNAEQYSANVENELLTRIGSVTTSNTVTEVALRAKAADLVHFDRQLSTANLTTLNAFSANVGTIVFVDSENVPYIRKVNGTWSFVDAVFSTQLKNAWAWGQNTYGKLGTNNTTVTSSPVSVVGGFTDWVFAQGGHSHSLGIRANGTLWSWGRNNTGQLGDNTTSSRSSPVSVIGGFTDWISVATGFYHSVALRANGTIYTWGYNNRGQLGNGTLLGGQSSPGSIVGGFTDWTMISAGYVHNVALRANGTLWSWGRNQVGQLGDNTNVNKSSPVSVIGGFTDWIMASSGNYHSHGIRANGILYGWGYNTNGQLGDGTNVAKNSPVSVIGGFTDWIFVTGGWSQTLAIRSNGTMWGWGTNYEGRLGINSFGGNFSSPLSVVGGFTDWVSVSTGRFHTVGLRANGTLWAWGGNGNGQLGTGDTTSKNSPASVIGGFTDWISVNISGGARHTIGLRGG